MNKFILCFAALVFCAAADGVFIPHELPCAYTVEYKETTIFQGHTSKTNGWHSVYGGNVNAVEKNGDGYQRNFYREDIRDPQDPTKGTEFMTQIDGKDEQCFSAEYYEPEHIELYSSAYKILVYPFPYSSSKNDTWDGKECVSYRYESASVNKTLYADYDNNVIAHVYDGTNLQTTVIQSVTNTSYQSDFIMKKSVDMKYCKGFDQVYYAPYVANCVIPENRPSAGNSVHSAFVAYMSLFTVIIMLLLA